MRTTTSFLAAGLGAAVLVLSACTTSSNDAPDTSSATTPDSTTGSLQAPDTITIDSVIGAGGTGTGGEAADSSMPAFDNYNFIAGDTLELPGNTTGWQYLATQPPQRDVVETLAALLDVGGTPVSGQDTGDEWAAWQVGPTDGSGPALTVTNDSLHSFYYSNSPDTSVSSACANVDADGQCSTEPADSTPDQTENAEAAARALLSELGEDPDSYTFETYADSYAATVTAAKLLEGVPSPVSWGFSYTPSGELLWMSGSLAAPVAVGPYELVDVDTAVARLNSTGTWFSYGATTGAVDDKGAGLEESVDSGDAGGELVDPGLGLPPAGGDPIDTTLVSVQAALWWVTDSEGNVWLLPAYTFGDTEGRQHTVAAVADRYLNTNDAAPEEPDTSGELPNIEFDANTIIGADTATAETTLAADNLELRVVREDGNDLPVTADYNPARVNVAVDNGVVTAVINFG